MYTGGRYLISSYNIVVSMYMCNTMYAKSKIIIHIITLIIIIIIL